jgi:hypothetical protein
VATSNQLRPWASTLRGWAPAVENTKVGERIVQLATELETLAQSKEVSDRQFL